MLELPGRLIIETDRDALYDALASDLFAAAEDAIERRGVFHVALSGGSTPEPFFVHMVIDPRFRLFPWPQTQVWMVDERCVSPDDDASNTKLLRESLIDHVTLKRRAFHPMPALEPDGDARYEAELREELGAEPRLDFALLGLGAEGHTASLFPGSPALHEQHRLVRFNVSEAADPPQRMTLTLPMLNASRRVAVLVTGAAKTPILRRVEQQLAIEPRPQALPITGIRPAEGRLMWFIDGAALRG